MPFLKKIGRLRKCLSNLPGRTLLPPLKRLEGDMKSRIHNDGKDSKGRFLNAGTNFKGPRQQDYSLEWAKNRKKRGRQTARKDFQDRGTLLLGLTVDVTRKNPSLGFKNDKTRILAENLEKQHGKPVWKPTPDERKRAVRGAVKAVFKEMRKCLK